MDRFFTKSFCSLLNASNDKLSNRGGKGEVLKLVTPDGGLRKKNVKKFLLFYKNNSILRSFQVKFRFEIPVLSSAKRTQNKHKKNWRAQTKLSDVLANDIMRGPRKEVKIFSYW